MNWLALLISVKLALYVCAALLVLGLPLAYWVAFSRWRWKFLIESVVALPLVLPPTVLGFYFLVAAGPHSPVGRLWRGVFGHGLAFTFSGLVLASVIYSLPFAVQPMATAFSLVDRSLLDAADLLGASRWRTFLRVIVPLSASGVLTGMVLSFAHTLGEFGVVLMVGGSIPGATETISISIYDDVQALRYASAYNAAGVLLLVSFASLCVIYALNQKVWPRVRQAGGPESIASA